MSRSYGASLKKLPREVGLRVFVSCPPEEDRCKQSEKSDCDIATIISKYGALPPPPVQPLTYADISALPDFRSALNLVVAAKARFAALPLALRERFMNDPGRFSDFVSNPENVEEMVRLGLAVKREPVVAPAPAPAKQEPAPGGAGAGAPPPPPPAPPKA